MGQTNTKPRRFGKYRLLTRIGIGGMAEVYKAEYAKDTGPPIAIKRILADLSQDKKLIGMLVNEAKLAMLLNHPNIVPIYDFGLVDGHYFMAMEYIEGQDLRAFLKKAYTEAKQIPLDVILHIIVSMLEGLNYAHTKKDNFNKPLEITHRDISPQNIIISYEGNVKILDFGIAKAKGSLSDTQAGILKGKFSYMSPEQARGKEIDPRSDIFSAGIVLYELLTVKSLFGGGSELKTLEKVRKARITNPSSVNGSIPKSLSKIVMKALAKRRWKRFQSAEEFRDQILIWSVDRGIKIKKDATKRYIMNEFPSSVRIAIIPPEPIIEELPKENTLIDPITDIPVSDPDISSDKPSEISIAETKVPEKPKSIIRDTLASLPNILNIFPKNVLKKQLSRIFSLKFLAIILLIGLSAYLFMKRNELQLGRDFYQKAYRELVLIPKSMVREYRLKKSKSTVRLRFDPNDAFYAPELITFSKDAKAYLATQPLSKFDKIIEHIKNQADMMDYEKLITSKADGYSIKSKKERPSANIHILSVRKVR